MLIIICGILVSSCFKRKVRKIVYYVFSSFLGQTPHQCEVCGKKYTRKEHLANHMRSHTNDTPFRCEICGKSFSRKEHFTNHILWHTGKLQTN